MGKGDIKTKKGKRSAGSYGVSRPKKIKKVIEVKPKAKKAAPKKKAAAKKPAAKKSTAKKATTKKTAEEKAD